MRALLRRDRALLGVWAIAMVGLVIGMVSGIRAGYPDQAARDAYAAAAMANPSQLALRGPIFATSVGGLLAWTVASSATLINGVIAVLLGVRHTRGDETAGRTELVAAGPVGRLAPTAAAVAASCAACAVMAVMAFAGLVAQGLPMAGSAVLSGMIGAGGALFVTVGVVAGQLVESVAAARAVGFSLVGMAFAVATVADLSGSPSAWLTPFGWARHAAAYAADRGWVVALPLTAAVVLVAVAGRIARSRDLGAAVLAARPGHRRGSSWLRSPVALAWRRQRGALLGWVLGLGSLGALLGSVASSLTGQLDTAAFRAMSGRLGGGDVGQVFFLFVLYVLAQVATAAAVATVLQLRTDETSGLLEPLLAGPVPRWRWATAQLLTATFVGAGVLTTIGLGAGLTSGDLIGLLAICWAYIPAVLIIVGLAVALVGWLPRAAVAVTWTVLAGLLFLDLLAEFGLAGGRILALSPYAATFHALTGGGSLPLAISGLLVASVSLAAIGMLGLRRRDALLP